MYIYIVLVVLSIFIGIQVKIRELCLITNKYNYTIQLPQIVTYSFILFSIPVICFDFLSSSILSCFSCLFIILPLLIINEWLLSFLPSGHFYKVWGVRILSSVLFCFFVFYFDGLTVLFPFFLYGIYLRNSPFGCPYVKDLCVESYMNRHVPVNWADSSIVKQYKIDNRNLPVYDVTKYGVVPDSFKDQLDVIQKIIDSAGRSGGGVIYFPKGKYFLNKSGDRFITINYSNIVIEGELSQEGKQLSSLVNCGKTSRGYKNPWTSPFIISCGERIQPSNEFWGLQFKKKKMSFKQSNSLSDPGSDGSILSPQYATSVVKSSPKGSSIIYVADSNKVSKYILLGMYNTTPDGNLLHEILGIKQFRPEWIEANRAGAEEAPSFQWLVEVKSIIDCSTIELASPLFMNCDVKYNPVIYNVDMLENISIRNIILSSKWNGMFRHHGFPLYYSVKKTQEMDYGWNGINLKRVAHGEISNIEISNYSNPIYLLDSVYCHVNNITIRGYDGHQGLKVYMHSCHNIIENITFLNHYADMMGGEGNAYCNTFRYIKYLNPEFNPVDYDFHGFAEGPMSPPAENIFTNIYGFRYMKSAGAVRNQPSCAINNRWINTITEGEKRGDFLFYNMVYREKKGLVRFITAVGYSVALMQKSHKISISKFLKDYKEKLALIDYMSIPRSKHYEIIPRGYVENIKTWGRIR